MSEPHSELHAALRPLVSEETRKKKRQTATHKTEAAGMKHAELRAEIMNRLTRRKQNKKQIAEALGLTVAKVNWYIKWSMERRLERLSGIPSTEHIPPSPPSPVPPLIRHKPIPGVVIASSTKPVRRPGLSADSPGLQHKVFAMRKHAIPFDEIAEILSAEYKVKLTPEIVRHANYNHLRNLQAQENTDTELERRMQVEQLDQMIRAITPSATGRNYDGSKYKEVAYEAIDRMIKLLDAKSKLMGLNAPQKVDIDVQLQAIAVHGGYDVDELREIASEVIESFEKMRALSPGR